MPGGETAAVGLPTLHGPVETSGDDGPEDFVGAHIRWLLAEQGNLSSKTRHVIKVGS